MSAGDTDIEQNDPVDYPHWNRIYIAVVLYTAATILGLWGFSQLFEP